MTLLHVNAPKLLYINAAPGALLLLLICSRRTEIKRHRDNCICIHVKRRLPPRRWKNTPNAASGSGDTFSPGHQTVIKISGGNVWLLIDVWLLCAAKLI